MGGKYDTYLVCEKGHGVNNSYYTNPEFNKKFCTECGSKTFKECPSCGEDIEGRLIFENIVSAINYDTVPEFCKYCGIKFPWVKDNISMKKEEFELYPEGVLEKIFNRFHLVVKQMEVRHNKRETLFEIKDEYDVQDLLHAILKIFFDDIRVEEPNPSHSGSSTRSDFLLKDENIAIEVKKTRSNLKGKQVAEQLIVDIEKYKTHPDYDTLFCFVYDPDGYIINPRGIETDLTRYDDNLKVIVKVLQK